MSFDQVGGLEHYVSALKEMVFLPLVYPELFERFKVQPPRGVLFYGPPGTGEGGEQNMDQGLVCKTCEVRGGEEGHGAAGYRLIISA